MLTVIAGDIVVLFVKALVVAAIVAFGIAWLFLPNVSAGLT